MVLFGKEKHKVFLFLLFSKILPKLDKYLHSEPMGITTSQVKMQNTSNTSETSFLPSVIHYPPKVIIAVRFITRG